MKYPCPLSFLLLTALSTILAFPAPAQDAAPARQAVDQAIARVKPALVRIHVVSTEYNGGREFKEQSTGSGAIIFSEGYVITNHHVAGHATRLSCTLADRQEIDADLIGADPLTDIAVIKLRPESPREFPTAVFGDSSAATAGQPVLALGSPMSLSQSVTMGIISNTEIIMPEILRMWGGVELDGEDVGTFVRWIGHDAQIAPGNSGGPLVNLNGEIIGINELEFGIGAAIPGNIARYVAEQLIRNGKVTRAWLGLSVQPQLKHSGDQRGALISGVIPASPADVAGIKPGDMLVQLNDTPVGVKFREELPELNLQIAALSIGQEATAKILRAGAEMTVKMTPVERASMKPKEEELEPWGITGSDVSLIAAKEMKRDTQDGVLITSLRPGGPAADAKPALSEKDIVVEVADKPIKNFEQLRQVTQELMKESKDPRPVLTTFERNRQRYVTVVKVGMRDLVDPGLEVTKAWLPVETQVITRDIAEQLGAPEMTGFRVASVYAGSSADKAGVKVGDLILAVDDQALTASAPEHYEELAALIRQYHIGDTATLSIRRGQEVVKVPVELVKSPKLNREMKEYRDENFDLTVREMSFFDKAREQLGETQPGVLVTEVTSGGWAAVAQVDVGDIITAIDGETITGLDAFEAKMKQLAEKQPPYVVLQIMRKIYSVYIEVEPNWNAASAGKEKS